MSDQDKKAPAEAAAAAAPAAEGGPAAATAAAPAAGSAGAGAGAATGGGEAPPQQLTAKQLERKARKEAAAAAKAAKAAARAAAGPKAPAAQKGAGRKGQRRAKVASSKPAAAKFVNTTPKGEKKDVSGPIAGAYDPTAVEAAWYDWWSAQGFFKADASKVASGEKKPFVMTIPPPNVTGALHMGHALTNSVEDAVIRHRRMAGFEVLWIPGTDHAGIATQSVVEKMLMKKEGKTRHDLGREAFLEKAWEWKGEYGGRIISQLQRLGSSLDWSREFFTMDDGLSAAVAEAFVQLWKKGKIFRAERLVNWSCKLTTAISDIEVDHIELTGRTMLSVPGHGDKQYEFGVLTSFAYKVAGPDGQPTDEEIVVATTRPETMLGDTAVAVHPKDDRYKHLHGARLVHPFFPDRVVRIVTDDILVDMAFGTGAVKVTPAHDPNDFACGQRTGAEAINILNEDGTLNENGGPFAGMKRFDAREAVIAALKEKDLYRGTTDNPMSLGLCSRSKDVIEPLLKPQWWVDCKEMAAAAGDAVREGQMEILPAEHVATWHRWLDNIRDWCISRQLWWGHRCPAYRVSTDGGKTLLPDIAENWIAAASPEAALEAARAKFADVAESPDQITVEQDPDVLDTWFSSALLPFSALGWPNNDHDDMKAFFPTALLETGHDILFFWVARMAMMSLELIGKVPFDKVYLHAMVRDAHGKKMSKSTGNVIDPVDMITGISLADLHAQLGVGNLDEKEIARAQAGQKADFPNGIPECGTDATRFALVSYTTQGRDINLDVLRVSAYRNFCNKMWNATKFVLHSIGSGAGAAAAGAAAAAGGENGKDEAPAFTPLSQADEDARTPATPEERWIYARLNAASAAAAKGWEEYMFSDMTTAIYDFWRADFCDVFIEFSKPILRGDAGPEAAESVRQTLYTCLEAALRLIHPTMPFVTEELWQRLPRRPNSDEPASIMLAAYPTPSDKRADAKLEAQVALVLEVIGAARRTRTRLVLTKHRPPLTIAARSDDILADLRPFERSLLSVCQGGEIQFTALGADTATPAGCAVEIVSENVQLFTQIRGIVDTTDEVRKLTSTATKFQKEIDTLNKRMSAPTYEEKVPAKVKAENADKLAAAKQQLADTEAAIATLKSFDE